MAKKKTDEEKAASLEERNARNHDRNLMSLMRLMQSSDDANTADMKDLAFAMIREFGGQDALAKHVFQTYSEAKEGSMNRIQLLKHVMGIIEKVSDESGGGVGIRGLTEDDLLVAASPIFGMMGDGEEADEDEGEGPAEEEAAEGEIISKPLIEYGPDGDAP